MPGTVLNILLLATAYAVGCCNTGYYLVLWLRGEDIRKKFSGSTGARNAGRILGKKGYAAVFAGDAGKGILVMGLGIWLPADARILPWLIPLVVAGHIWPVQLGFSGGKGVATAFGGMLLLDFRLPLAFCLIYLAIRWAAKNSMAALVAGAVALPWLPYPSWSPSQSSALGAMSLLVLLSHRDHFLPGRPSTQE